MGKTPTNLTFYAPIEKTDEDKRMVYGYASTEAVDSQGEIVKKDALKLALSDYMKYANIREMHQPSAVGKAKQANIDAKGLYIAAKVVDDAAWQKVKEGVYSGFSIGGRVESMIDNEITALKLAEISLVDRPANPEAVFDVYKAEGMEVKPEEKSEDAEEEQVEEKDETVSEKSEVIEETKVDNVEEVEEIEKGRKKKEDEEEEPKTDPAEQKVGEDKPATDREPAKPETVEQPKETPPAAPATVEQPTENKELADEPKDLKKQLDEKLHAGVMPTDEELGALLKEEGIEATTNAINVLRYDLAGVLLKYVQKAIADQHEQDAKADAIEKAQKETPIVADKPHKFDGVIALVDKLEDELVKAVQAAPVSPKAPNETVSEALAMLQRAIEILSSQGTGNQLTPTEEEKLRNGVTAGSEKTSSGRIQDDTKAEATQDLAKLEGEVAGLKAQLEKIAKMPEPVKVVASFQTINKFETAPAHDALEKAEARSKELQAILKGPHSPRDEEEASTLSLEIMKLRRNVQAPVN